MSITLLIVFNNLIRYGSFEEALIPPSCLGCKEKPPICSGEGSAWDLGQVVFNALG